MVSGTPRMRSLLGALAVALTASLSGCITGERPRLVEGATATDDPAADDVLRRLDTAGEATYSGDYTVVTRFGNVTTDAHVAQEGSARRAVTVGRVRYIVDGGQTATCDLDSRECNDAIDVSRISDRQLTVDFYAASPAARLRRDTEQRTGATEASTERIAGQRATCVTVPVAGGESTYCALNSGPLARLDAADLSIELTAYSPTPDETQFERPD